MSFRNPVRQPEPTAAAPVGPPRLRTAHEELSRHLVAARLKGSILLAERRGDTAALERQRRALQTWQEYVDTLLRRYFDQPGPADAFSHRGPACPVSTEQTLADRWDLFLGDVQDTLRRLESLQERLALYEVAPERDDLQSGGTRAATEPVNGKPVFVVHGHDGHTKVVVARFLAQLLGDEPVILHEQPDGGGTLIEKLEANAARAGAAVVLLTADDLGGTRAGSGDTGTDPGPQQARARQNVVFEHGYFLAALGRKHVVMLYEPTVEIPSDLSGVVYTPLDTGGLWKNLLARNLKHMGYDVNLDALLRG